MCATGHRTVRHELAITSDGTNGTSGIWDCRQMHHAVDGSRWRWRPSWRFHCGPARARARRRPAAGQGSTQSAWDSGQFSLNKGRFAASTAGATRSAGTALLYGISAPQERLHRRVRSWTNNNDYLQGPVGNNAPANVYSPLAADDGRPDRKHRSARVHARERPTSSSSTRHDRPRHHPRGLDRRDHQRVKNTGQRRSSGRCPLPARSAGRPRRRADLPAGGNRARRSRSTRRPSRRPRSGAGASRTTAQRHAADVRAVDRQRSPVVAIGPRPRRRR